MKWNLEHTYANLTGHFFNEEKPVEPAKPEMVVFNTELAHELGLSFLTKDPKQTAKLLSGYQLPESARPIAQAYAGHQFGYFTMLGDGRAILLGEKITKDGNRVDIQLKGSGSTKYSRNGDGLATMSSMLREFLMSEAMYYLGIPTTRSLAVIKNGLPVYRENVEEGALLTRVASSHIRTGTFEYVRQFGTSEELSILVNYVIKRHYPELKNADNKALELLKAVMARQIDLVVDWMRVGFIHGVMNTDNMSISGETIDYGPCAFMNKYNPKSVFSSIDRGGRYAFENQPWISGWNISVLAGTLLPLIDESEQDAVDIANEILATYEDNFKNKWFQMMCCKLGILNPSDADNELIGQLMVMLEKYQPDYTQFFLSIESVELMGEPVFSTEAFKQWYEQWKNRIKQGQTVKEAKDLMRQNNPAIIPRNHLVEEALSDAVNGNINTFNSLLEVLSQPYIRSEKTFRMQEVPEGFDQTYKTYCGT